MAAFTANRTGVKAAPKSRYGGIVGSDTRDPLLNPGVYRTRVLALSQGQNPGKANRECVKVSLRITQMIEAAEPPEPPKEGEQAEKFFPSNEAGTSATVICFVNPAGLADLKRLTVAAAGFGPTLEQRRDPKEDPRALMIAGEEEFNTLDESFGYAGAIIEASLGLATPEKTPSIVGRTLDVIVTRGKEIPNPQTGQGTGAYFSNYEWCAVPDSEQE